MDGDVLTFFIVTEPLNGSVIISDNNNGLFTYYPEENFFGTDQFTYSVSDGQVVTDAATVTYAVSSVNDLPSSFQILNPEFNSEVTTLTPYLDWTSSIDVDVGDVLSYRLYFDDFEPGLSIIE